MASNLLIMSPHPRQLFRQFHLRSMKTILLVDDEAGSLEMIRSLLENPGYRFIMKGDGRSALALVAAGEQVDLVITDYRMPEMNGIELLAALKQTAPSVPVVMITNFARADLYVNALLLGAVEFLEKAFLPQMLERVVQEALRSTEGPNAGTIDESMNEGN